jgi:hypothetical protein
MPDPDALAAELAAIEQRQEHGDLREFATADSPRLIELARDVLVLAGKWRRQSTTGRDASALHADELRRVIEARLLGEGGSGNG